MGRNCVFFKMKHIEIRESFLAYRSPLVPTKAFACMYVHIFCTIYESGVLAQGRVCVCGGGGGRIVCGCVKQIWYLSPMRAAKVQASLRIRAVSPEPPLLVHTSSESRGTFRQKARFLAPLNGWACAVKICHDGMLEDTDSLDGAQLTQVLSLRYFARY